MVWIGWEMTNLWQDEKVFSQLFLLERLWTRRFSMSPKRQTHASSSYCFTIFFNLVYCVLFVRWIWTYSEHDRLRNKKVIIVGTFDILVDLSGEKVMSRNGSTGWFRRKPKKIFCTLFLWVDNRHRTDLWSCRKNYFLFGLVNFREILMLKTNENLFLTVIISEFPNRISL